MCAMFAGMIDKTEQVYSCIVVCFCCDNDGGSQSGRKQLILVRGYLAPLAALTKCVPH
jgi:hypothetical protein